MCVCVCVRVVILGNPCVRGPWKASNLLIKQSVPLESEGSCLLRSTKLLKWISGDTSVCASWILSGSQEMLACVSVCVVAPYQDVQLCVCVCVRSVLRKPMRVCVCGP